MLHFGACLPVFRTKKEAFEWLKTGKKTIDVRKGQPRRGEIAVYLSGRRVLRMKITKKEMGSIEEVVQTNNYRMIIPSAATVEEAVVYLRTLYGGYEGVFTAYHVVSLVVETF
jgi:ASC-1-like (ASCH) protein